MYGIGDWGGVGTGIGGPVVGGPGLGAHETVGTMRNLCHGVVVATSWQPAVDC